MSVDIKIRTTENTETNNIDINVFLDRDKETDLEMKVARSLYSRVMEVLEVTLPPSDNSEQDTTPTTANSTEEPKIIIP